MNETKSAFHWVIDQAACWPPRGRPKPPFSSTILDVMRSCPLRACFECSNGYERRIGFPARVGIAFHRTLQALNEYISRPGSPEPILEWARQKFLSELEQQEVERSTRPRERGLPRDEMRVYRAVESIITEARRVSLEGNFVHTLFHTRSVEMQPVKRKVMTQYAFVGTKVYVEILIESRSKLFNGRIDRVEERPEGIILYDYKSAVRNDLPERYERQLQFYAWLWYEATGKWPTSALVIYPFTGMIHSVAIDAETCEKIVEEYRSLIDQIQYGSKAEELATPGEVCQVCDFRPWCCPFWRWQSEESRHSIALERATMGFEGTIQELQQIEYHWKIMVRWRNLTIRIIAPLERLPHLKNGQRGMSVRVLEMRLHGQMMAPTARVTEMSELFFVN
jgi:hypothetical protein